MSYSETTYYFFGARLTDEQAEIASEQDFTDGIEPMSLGDGCGGDMLHFLAVGIREPAVEDEPVAFDAPPSLPVERLRALGIALEDLGVTEQPRWWLGVRGG